MKYCLIGYPINHSLSPFIHYRLCKNLWKCEYKLESCKTINIDFLKDNYNGFNVTMPYKEKIIPYLDELTETAKNIHSVNTVKISQGKLYGHSTDGEGFLLDFHRVFKCDFYNKNVCIMGTGGTAKSISYAIKKENPKNIFYLSRNKKGNNIFSYNDKTFLNECNVIINTTPVGMVENKCLLDKSDINKNMLLYDVIYNINTEFLRLGKTVGAKTSNGFGMLVFQGLLSQEFWNNTKIDLNICKEIIGVNFEEKEIQ